MGGIAYWMAEQESLTLWCGVGLPSLKSITGTFPSEPVSTAIYDELSRSNSPAADLLSPLFSQRKQRYREVNSLVQGHRAELKSPFLGNSPADLPPQFMLATISRPL